MKQEEIKIANNKVAGDSGELEVIALVPCPNCGKKLMVLPPNYPLYDVQCTGCSFRAQVKTNNCKPKAEIFGAGWDIIDKVLKSGFMTPPLIANFKWIEKGIPKQEIYFYPFVPKTHLKKRVLSSTARRANYAMFNYIDLHKLPNLKLYTK
jgi:DNA-directed RNA polymerase subunit RPC12/RpoP